MTNDTTFNGFTNKQTWSINLTYSEVFINMAEEQEYDDVEHMADSFESLVDELEFNELRVGTLAHQAVGEYLEAVNWEEIAGHYFVEKEEESEEDIKGLRELLAEAGIN
jgi:hypothetical protein